MVSLISLQQLTLILTKQTEEIYACVGCGELYIASEREFQFLRPQPQDGEEVHFVPKGALPLLLLLLLLSGAAHKGGECEAWALCTGSY